MHSFLTPFETKFLLVSSFFVFNITVEKYIYIEKASKLQYKQYGGCTIMLKQ